MPSRTRLARQQLAPALLQRAVLLEAVDDPVQRRGVDAELGASLAHGDARPRLDHLHELVAAAGAAGPAAGTLDGDAARRPVRRGAIRTACGAGRARARRAAARGATPWGGRVG